MNTAGIDLAKLFEVSLNRSSGLRVTTIGYGFEPLVVFGSFKDLSCMRTCDVSVGQVIIIQYRYKRRMCSALEALIATSDGNFLILIA